MLELMVVAGRPSGSIAPDAAFLGALGSAYDVPDRYPFRFSYVVDKSTMLPIEAILRYLTFSASKRSNTEVTIKNKADGCYELFLYLDAIEVDYRDICLETLIEYKERLASFVSAKTKRPLADGTIKARLQVAREFCVYHRILPATEASGLKGKPGRGEAHSNSARQVTALFVENKTALIEYVNVGDLSRLLASLGDAPGRSDGRTSRDWLLATFCVTTGVRLSEALGLTVNQVLHAASGSNKSRIARIVLVKTKRSKPREIDVDRGLIDLLISYIDNERRAAVAIGLAHRRRTRETGNLFVNGSDCAPRFAGLPYQAKRAEEYFAACQMRISMTRVVSIHDLDTREVTGERSIHRHTIHHLRHTYAIQAWNAYRNLPETDRWIRIQGQLGHKSYEVTANTYLRAVKHFEANARDEMGVFFKSLMFLAPQ